MYVLYLLIFLLRVRIAVFMSIIENEGEKIPSGLMQPFAFKLLTLSTYAYSILAHFGALGGLHYKVTYLKVL